MIRAFLFILGLALEAYGFYRTAVSGTYEEATFWVALATYVAVVAVASRQIANGHVYLPRKGKS